MKAIVKKNPEPGLVLEDVPMPEIGDTDVLVKIKKNSICGTDIHIEKWDAWAQKNIPTPLVIGHEFMGVIEKLGKDVKELKVGQRVSGEGHLTCGHCSNCRKGLKHLCVKTKGIGIHHDGCFAEYLSIPAENIFPLPDFIQDDIASIFDPYGNAMHSTLSYELAGEDVLITGAGPIGIMSAAIAKKAGARNVVITDFNEYRLQLAGKMGATYIVNLNKMSVDDVIKSLDIEEGFTVGLEMSGAPEAFNTLLEKLQHGGKIALLGLIPPHTEIDWDHVIFKMLTIKGIYGREIFSTWFKMVHMLESGLDLNPIITHHYPVDDFQKGFDVMKSGNCGKVILDWEQ